MRKEALNKLALEYQELLRAKFEGVHVKHNLDAPGYDDFPVLDVFCIPDAKLKEFVRYKLKGLSADAQVKGLADTLLVQHTVSETKEHYAAIWAEIQSAPEVLGGYVAVTITLNDPIKLMSSSQAVHYVDFGARTQASSE